MNTSPFVETILSSDPAIRSRSIDQLCAGRSAAQLIQDAEELEAFRHASGNLYDRVRACFFLYSIHRFQIPQRPGLHANSSIPYHGYVHLLGRRFEEAIELFLIAQKQQGPGDGLSSALASAYHALAFQTLADQVRSSVRQVRGNQWMFRVGHPGDQPLRVRPELYAPLTEGAPAPILKESTPVRMDMTHSGWSDIFFLGMDYPEGAKVLNVSIDLAVRGRDQHPRPPVEAYFRVIEEPVVRLTSVDLGVSADITDLAELFDFARDYLGLLKGALIASGLVPPGIEGSGQQLSDLLARLLGNGPGRGIELISCVNGIPKGSRLAVSTNLLASLISVCMRATSQTESVTGTLTEPERRLVAARAILGEWIAGSGGGWQDSGGVWPGIKLITGQPASEGDAEFGLSRGRLLPSHTILDREQVSDETRQKLQDSLILVHGGMAQNVGPILEMVTEKYLLRSEREWNARANTLSILDDILGCLKRGDIKALGAATTRNYLGPIQTIVPWADNLYTTTLIESMQKELGDDFWGFWMLGGMSGGGMGFICDPARKEEAQDHLHRIMNAERQRLQHSLPFAMDPVVYNFAINEHGTRAELLDAGSAPLPAGYYALTVPALLKQSLRDLPAGRRAELDAFGTACRTREEFSGMVQQLFDHMLPRSGGASQGRQQLEALLSENGFDSESHELIRSELKAGRIGLAQNRLPINAEIKDVLPGDVLDGIGSVPAEVVSLGEEALRQGLVGVMSLAAGVGSRWTQGAGVVKALHPFARLGGRHRTFVETHLAKSRQIGTRYGASIPHIFSTSHLTHGAMEALLKSVDNYGYPGPLVLSRGRSIGLRMIPTERDLRFAWEEMPQQVLDVRAQKMRESVRAALIGWAQSMGEGADYTDNLATQCLHPVGHWYELPNFIKNGALADLLEQRPQLKYLMLHNIDTVGADVDPAMLGLHINSGSALSFEVTPRRLEDRGGGLARVDGRVRLVEGLAMPHEEDEFALTYYNSMTTWIDIDLLLQVFGLTRSQLRNAIAVTAGIRQVASRMPTYVTIKDVKKRWGHGQEDVLPVTQFEKLWGDMSALPDVAVSFIAVPRSRGQQLKEQAQLDGWLRDGSAAYVETLCQWE